MVQAERASLPGEEPRGPAVSEMWFPTRIVFGEGAVRRLPQELARLNARKPLVVTDPTLARTGLLARCTGPLEEAGLGFAAFQDVDPDPTDGTVDRALAAYRASGCDALVALGGGSSIDTAKAVRLLVAHPPPLARYDSARDGGRLVTNPMPPMVALPTTAGTGSEVGRMSVVTLAETGRKTLIVAQGLVPSTAICDPELTYGMPPWLTAATGMDTLAHSLESRCARGMHPLADAVAQKGLELCGRYLARAVRDGGDKEARAAMVMAAVAGGTALQKGLGAAHSLSHALTHVCGIHHGVATAMSLPAMMEFNLDVAAPQLAEVAVALGAPPSDDERALARLAVERVRALSREIGIPERLRDARVREEQLPLLAEKALQDNCHRTNPRPCRGEDLLAMLRASY